MPYRVVSPADWGTGRGGGPGSQAEAGGGEAGAHSCGTTVWEPCTRVAGQWTRPAAAARVPRGPSSPPAARSRALRRGKRAGPPRARDGARRPASTPVTGSAPCAAPLGTRDAPGQLPDSAPPSCARCGSRRAAAEEEHPSRAPHRQGRGVGRASLPGKKDGLRTPAVSPLGVRAPPRSRAPPLPASVPRPPTKVY